MILKSPLFIITLKSFLNYPEIILESCFSQTLVLSENAAITNSLFSSLGSLSQGVRLVSQRRASLLSEKAPLASSQLSGAHSRGWLDAATLNALIGQGSQAS